MKSIISARIKELRKEKGINQTELSALAGVKQSCVSKWERGETLPDAEMIALLCQIFNVSADYLLGLSDI